MWAFGVCDTLASELVWVNLHTVSQIIGSLTIVSMFKFGCEASLNSVSYSFFSLMFTSLLITTFLACMFCSSFCLFLHEKCMRQGIYLPALNNIMPCLFTLQVYLKWCCNRSASRLSSHQWVAGTSATVELVLSLTSGSSILYCSDRMEYASKLMHGSVVASGQLLQLLFLLPDLKDHLWKWRGMVNGGIVFWMVFRVIVCTFKFLTVQFKYSQVG